MKRIMAILAIVSTTAVAQPSRPFDFELEPGCMWTKERAACVVNNRYKAPITCQVDISARTFVGRGVNTSRKVVIPAGSFETIRVFSPPNNVLTYVGGVAECRAG